MADSPVVDTPWTLTLDYNYPDMTTVDDDAAWSPARRAALAAQRQRVESIGADTDPATVENVLHAFALSGTELDRLIRAFGVVAAADGTEARQQVRAEAAPEMAAHTDWITLHPGLFARFRQLRERIAAGEVAATDEQQWFLEQQILKATVAGAGLDSSGQAELKELNQRLAELETAYSRLQVREAGEAALLVETAEELAGLSDSRIASAKAAAEAAGHSSGYLLSLTMPVQQPLLGSLENRETRWRLHTASVTRSSLKDEQGRTTRAIGAQIAVLRARKARLLGYENFLESVLPLRTAPSREAVESMLRKLASGAAERARAETEKVTEHLGFVPEPCDLTFGIEQVRKTLPAGAAGAEITVEEGLRRVFDAAHRTYGITVMERQDLPSYVPGARSFEVFDGAAGEPGTGLGLFLLDLYTRPTKSGGAWMNGFSVPSSLAGSKAVVTNNLNVAPPAEGQEPVLTKGEQKTLFHEFGHALHALLADAEFPQLSGTAVPRDNVEFPSQVNEVFQELYHNPTPPGAVPDDDALWGKGSSTAEHVAAVVIDLAWHTLSPQQAETAAEDPAGFEAQVLADWGLDLPLVPPRYHGGFFKHIFASAGYAAGYYSYLWAEVLAAHSSEWFREVLGDDVALASRGAHFRAELLARGNTRDPLESFRVALGTDPDPAHLLRSLGLG
ncbi:M3 family metallopeptidase [Nesterenkonia ebinurensis]|uniref:M3 family metallopeptidase n=1 Tax=Nesterenkonia ebinurensis TaxID=2608252 RepID=UPI00123DF117|nr:M3 family metallopeptidase [Nesterenkonia ebinurensis]